MIIPDRSPQRRQVGWEHLFVLIMRHRFSDLVAKPVADSEQEKSDRERDAMTVAHSVALQLISTHLQIAQKGLMTYCK